MAEHAAPATGQTRVLDTGLRVPWSVYGFKLLHPLLERCGRFLLQGRQRRRYFVMPGDYVSDYTARFGSFEAEEIAIARHICRHGLGFERMAAGSMIDAGCHIGNYSVELGPDFGAVLAIDAVQSYAHVARANLDWNGLQDKSTVVCAAVSDHEGALRLQIERQGNLGHARVDAGATPADGAGTMVQALPLDTLVQRQGLADVSFIKFDVEGHEVAALQGARQTIAAHAPVLQVEVDRGHLPALRDALRATGVGYEAWQVVRGNPHCRHLAARLWQALRAGGNPVFVKRLADDEINPRHLPCVLMVPAALRIDWPALFPIGRARPGDEQ